MNTEHRTPSYSLVKSAIDPGDVVYVLDEKGKFVPVVVLEVKKKSLRTEVGDILFEDYGWLWRVRNK